MLQSGATKKAGKGSGKLALGIGKGTGKGLFRAGKKAGSAGMDAAGLGPVPLDENGNPILPPEKKVRKKLTGWDDEEGIEANPLSDWDADIENAVGQSLCLLRLSCSLQPLIGAVLCRATPRTCLCRRTKRRRRSYPRKRS